MNNLSIRSQSVLVTLAAISMIFLYLVECGPDFKIIKPHNEEIELIKTLETSSLDNSDLLGIIDLKLAHKQYNMMHVSGMLLFLIISIGMITIAENRRNALGNNSTV